MSSPITAAALTTFPKGPAQSPDNLTSLPSAQAKGLGSLGTALTQYYDDNIAPLMIKSGSGASGTGSVSLYLVVSEDGANWTDGIDPDSTGDQAAKIKTARQIGKIDNIAASTSYIFDEWSVFSAVNMGFMPSFWAVVVLNSSGGALDATNTNFSAKHTLISYA